MSVQLKLQKIRVELNNLNLKKTGKNNNSNYGYFELKDFLPQALNLFAEHKLFSKFDIINKVINDNGVFEEMATLEIFDTESDTSVIFETPTAEVKIGVRKDGTGGAQPIQNLGGKHTYLKRYLYQNALELSVNDVVDETINDEPQYEIFVQMFIPESQAKKIIGESLRLLLSKVGGRVADFNKAFTDRTLGGTLAEANIKQLLNSERLLRTVNKSSNEWHWLYGLNNKIKNPIDKEVEFKYESSYEKFGKLALETSKDETQKLDILEYYQNHIDLTDFFEGLNND